MRVKFLKTCKIGTSVYKKGEEVDIEIPESWIEKMQGQVFEIVEKKKERRKKEKIEEGEGQILEKTEGGVENGLEPYQGQRRENSD